MNFNQLLLLTFCLIFISCKKKNNPTPDTNSPDLSFADTITIDSRYQFSGYINNEFISFVDGVNTFYVEGSAAYDAADDPNSYKCFLGSSMDEPGSHRILFNKGVLYYTDGEFPSYAEGYDFFSPGTYGFCDIWENGFTLSYKDNDGVEWKTKSGNLNQNENTAEVLDRKFDSSNPIAYIFKVLIEFNCTLYNSSGQSIKVNKGMFVGKIYIAKPIPM